MHIEIIRQLKAAMRSQIRKNNCTSIPVFYGKFEEFSRITSDANCGTALNPDSFIKKAGSFLILLFCLS
jgi:hypothetical protein